MPKEEAPRLRARDNNAHYWYAQLFSCQVDNDDVFETRIREAVEKVPNIVIDVCMLNRGYRRIRVRVAALHQPFRIDWGGLTSDVNQVLASTLDMRHPTLRSLCQRSIDCHARIRM